MKLLYDLTSTQPSSVAKFHGGGKYGWVVFRECVKQHIPMECIYDSKRLLPKDILSLIGENIIKSYDISKVSYETIFKNQDISTYYTPLDDPRIKNIIPSEIKYLTTIHGLRAIEMPRDWMFLKYKGYLNINFKGRFIRLISLIFYNTIKTRLIKSFSSRFTENDELIVVSNHTKYSCLTYMPHIKPNNIHVFYSPSTSVDNSHITPYDAGDKYILMVSGNRHEKNILRVIIAIDELFSKRIELRNFKIIIAGAKESDYYFKIKNTQNFIFMGYVDEDLLDSLYKGAYLFVYPSLNEGFGYPPLEAMHYSVPVIASPHTSISEVCGDAALYFNPYDIGEIKGRIYTLLSDPIMYETYKNLSHNRFNIITRKQNEDLRSLVHYLSNNIRL